MIFKKETYEIVGAAMNVHKELGGGFLESVYQEAFGIELADQNIPFEKEVKLPIIFKGNTLTKFFIADFVCHGDIIVELKSCSMILDEHYAQVINYLKATNKPLGLLLNFSPKSLEFKRIILDPKSDS
ncbi:GxxExxY protein [Algoriphagus sp. CAU 1675]|uniref:GxxExxY protein n=1 Tax=Algoriphagus sp. CAU 1675 TaxID=3032597 RepID=UPI0023DC7294|nr:GxxExxY protein [Algoriphagus sp. CAU 1675]MDF2158200.1 GxxExxY protein [Algoriphagus sp. CAU 1675]